MDWNIGLFSTIYHLTFQSVLSFSLQSRTGGSNNGQMTANRRTQHWLMAWKHPTEFSPNNQTKNLPTKNLSRISGWAFQRACFCFFSPLRSVMTYHQLKESRDWLIVIYTQRSCGRGRTCWVGHWFPGAIAVKLSRNGDILVLIRKWPSRLKALLQFRGNSWHPIAKIRSSSNSSFFFFFRCRRIPTCCSCAVAKHSFHSRIFIWTQ